MNKRSKNTLIITGIILLLSAAVAAGFFWGFNYSKKMTTKEMDLSPHQFTKDFKIINKAVKKRCSHLKNKQINIDSLYSVYSEHIDSAKTIDKYKKALLAYFAEIQNMHTNVRLTPTYRIRCNAKLVDNKVFIDWISDSEKDLGISVKDEILSIDGIPTLEWLDQQQKFVNASTDEARLNKAVNHIFFSYFKGKRTLTLNTSTGIKEVEYFLNKSTYDVEGSVINDSIGYIAINSMDGDIVADFKEEFKKLRTKPILIVDLRKNGGGSVANSEEITEYLLRKEKTACASEKPLTPHENHYQGKLFLLTGINTSSAAERLSLDLKESGDAILIGSETGGDPANMVGIATTKYGTSFRIPIGKSKQVSPQGFPMEGVGIPPDFVVYQNIDDYLDDIDTVLEFAVNKALGVE